MSRDDAIARNGRIADAFVLRLSALGSAGLSSATIPDVNTDPYLGAILRANDEIAGAGKGANGATARLRDHLSRTDSAIGAVGLPQPIDELARNAVRGILVHSMLHNQLLGIELYRPFEPFFPFEELTASD